MTADLSLLPPRSLGVLTYVLLTGFLPFGGETDQETFLEITLGELDFPEELFEDISAEAIDFIKKLLIRKPQYDDPHVLSSETFSDSEIIKHIFSLTTRV